jgi:hypothetical protein
VRAAQQSLVAPTLVGGVTLQEVVEGVTTSGIFKNSPKNRQFPGFFYLKIARNAIFYSKELKKIYFKDFFEEYMNFKNFVA